MDVTSSSELKPSGLRQVLAWLVLAAVLAYAAFFRFAGISERGVIDTVDCWKYLVAGKQWSEGDCAWMNRGWNEPDGFYRPAIHVLHALTIRLLGYNDFSIKIVNCSLDLASMALIYMILVSLTRSRWIGILTVILYAFLPKAVEIAWCEMPHTPPLFLILVATILYLHSEAETRRLRGRLSLLFLSGCCIGLCAQMHPDLALVAPGYVATILLVAVSRNRLGQAGVRFGLGAAAFTVGFAFPYLVGLVCFGPTEVVGVIRHEFVHQTGIYAVKTGHTDFILRALQVLYNSVFGLFQERLVVLYLFGAALLLALTRPRFGARYDPLGYLAPILVLCYAVGYAVGIGEFPARLDRVFMPLVPLLLIATTYWFYVAGRALSGRLAGPLLTVLFLWLAWHNPHMTPSMVGTGRFAPERERIVYNAMKDRIDEQNRLLISPLVTLLSPGSGWGGPWGLANDIYFGSNALYIGDVPDFLLPYRIESLDKAWRENHVKYFMLALYNSQMQWLPFFPAFHTFADGSPYTIDEEMKVVFPFFALAGARKLTQIDLVEPDSVYELFRPEPVKQWDFAVLPQAQWDWLFSKAAQGPTPDGALCPEVPGKMVNLSLSKETINADAVKGLRIECAWKTPDGSWHPPAMVDIIWTAQVPGDKASESVPFYGPTRLLNPDPSRPTIYVARLDGVPQWTGTISALSLRIVLPTLPPHQNALQEVPVAVRSIALFAY